MRPGEAELRPRRAKNQALCRGSRCRSFEGRRSRSRSAAKSNAGLIISAAECIDRTAAVPAPFESAISKTFKTMKDRAHASAAETSAPKGATAFLQRTQNAATKKIKKLGHI